MIRFLSFPECSSRISEKNILKPPNDEKPLIQELLSIYISKHRNIIKNVISVVSFEGLAVFPFLLLSFWMR